MMIPFYYEPFVTELCDPELDGRVPGTPGHDTARTMIVNSLADLKLEPLLASGYEQSYKAAMGGITGRNLLGVKRGTGAQGKWVLLGAHYDHLAGCPGASDNAASVGVVLEAIRRLSERHHDCDVVVAIFDMEEPPFFNDERSMGSYIFHDRCPEGFDLALLQCAVVLDLVGHQTEIPGKEQSLFALGVQSGPGLKQALFDAREPLSDLEVYGSSVHVGLSDHNVFYENQRPHLFLTSGRAHHYHTANDTIDKLDFKKMSNISELIANFVVSLDRNQTAERFTEDDHAAEMSRFFQKEIDVDQLPLVLMQLQAKL